MKAYSYVSFPQNINNKEFTLVLLSAFLESKNKTDKAKRF